MHCLQDISILPHLEPEHTTQSSKHMFMKHLSTSVGITEGSAVLREELHSEACNLGFLLAPSQALSPSLLSSPTLPLSHNQHIFCFLLHTAIHSGHLWSQFPPTIICQESWKSNILERESNYPEQNSSENHFYHCVAFRFSIPPNIPCCMPVCHWPLSNNISSILYLNFLYVHLVLLLFSEFWEVQTLHTHFCISLEYLKHTVLAL